MKLPMHRHPAYLVVLSAIVALGLPLPVSAAGPDSHRLRTSVVGKVPSFVHLLSKRAGRKSAPQSASAYTVVAGGLRSPRGLTFGPGERLYVAEAGLVAGYDGAIDEILNAQSANPTLRTVVSGLASTGGDGEVIGVGGISAHGNGGIYAIIGESPELTGNPAFGQLLKVTKSGSMKVVANVGTVNYQFTAAHPELDPGNQYPDANPYGVLALPGRTYVTDAGANTLNEVLPNGQVKILAYFENNITSDSTPTCVAQGPDGALYIGTLSLVDSLVFGPSAKVYRVDPKTLPAGNGVPIIGQAFEWATGLWPINGCAFGPDGTFYVSQLFTAGDFSGGDVVKIPFNSPNTHISLTGGTLPLAAGVAVARDGTVFAVGLTAFAPAGFVARLAQH